ncbi:MAG TPA: hypothetical protein VFB20_08670 [Burkholderiales bacterium]|nr:hypothetical protein [Burkholderiales bacterium]
MFRSITLAGFLAGFTSLAFGQGDPWTQHGDWAKSRINACQAASGGALDACRYFAAEAFKELFGIEDFCTADRCMTAPEIESGIRNNPEKWSVLGAASDPAVLDKARELAGQGQVVVAGQNVEDRSQVAIIMPGKPVPSGKWAMDRVPIGTAARTDAPDRSIYGEGINWVFSDPAKVTLYVRH